ncbi:MAG: hypothetical protein DRJ15_08240 [Bacteroidetes bacterium]|nr:MAG: hypothetical protein DRJ15_08240 [Bacteroidota bacterium]
MKNIFTLIVILLSGFGSYAQVERTLVVEHFTNTRCSSCATANPALFSLLDSYPQVLHISYHPSSPYSNCAFYLHNPSENDGRTNFYGIYGATPRVVLQGEVVGFQIPILNADQLEAQLGQTSDFDIHIDQDKLENDMVHVSITVKKLSTTSSQSQKIYAIIAEKEVDYAAPNGENPHYEVFRKVLLNQVIDILVGDSVVFNTSYTINSEWDEDELIVTAMVQDADNKMILQARESEKLNANPSFIRDKEILSLDGALYPNPATDVVYLSNAVRKNFVQADFYAISGNKVKTFTDPRAMNISDLPEGIYMAVLTDSEQKQHITRIVKR